MNLIIICTKKKPILAEKKHFSVYFHPHSGVISIFRQKMCGLDLSEMDIKTFKPAPTINKLLKHTQGYIPKLEIKNYSSIKHCGKTKVDAIDG